MMSKTIGLTGALVLGLSAFVAGCGSSAGGGGGGPPVDFTALRAQYTAPSGSLQSSDILNVGGALAKQQTQSSGIPVSTSSAKIRAMAQRLRGAGAPRTQDTPVTCSAASGGGAVSCTCDGGGTLTESFNENATQTGVSEGTIDYDSCSFDDTGSSGTESISGSMSYADYTTAPAMFIYSGSLTVEITPPGTTTTETFNYALINGEETYSVSVASGTVLVSSDGSWDASTNTGSFTVTDKAGTWSCNVTNGAGSCTGPGGTLTI